ncbi:MAG: SIR2 family protein [Bauldia sp.]|nr:SIR2 family protein [Bauldia sp.]
MDRLKAALNSPYPGQIILFLGAGFSAAVASTTIPDGKGLAEAFNSGLKTTGLPLQVAAYEYLQKFKADAYTELLRSLYHVSEPIPPAVSLSSHPWLRIYTTNYDNIVEVSGAIPTTKVASTYKTAVSLALQASVIHINGFIDHIQPNAAPDLFKLKFDDYDRPLDDNLLYVLQRDLDIAKYVIFCGYSLYDLDVRRALAAANKDRLSVFFITSADPAPQDISIFEKYGLTVPIGALQFADLVAATPAPDARLTDAIFTSINFEEHVLPPSQTNVLSNEQVLRIYTLGGIDPGHFSANETQPKVVLEREAVSAALMALDGSERLLVIHSDIGNGKSAAVRHLIQQLSIRKYRCFLYAGGAKPDPGELQFFSRLGARACLFFDSDLISPSTALDYADRLPQAKIIYALRSVHLELRKRGGWDKLRLFVTLNLNILSPSERQQIDTIFSTYGLWGKPDTRGKTRDRVLTASNTDLRSILLTLFQTEQIKQSIASGVAEIVATKDEVRNTFILILILSYFGLRPAIPIIQRIAGMGVLEHFLRIVEQDSDISEHLQYKDGEFRFYSPIYAEFVMKSIVRDDDKREVMLLIHRRMENFELGVVRSLRTSLVRFGEINQLFADGPHRAARILSYYEAVSRLKSMSKDFLFWLQFAIACNVFDRFDLADQYFATAYDLAEQGKHDPFQIDNHYAKFLLKSRSKRADSYSDFFWAFDEAHRLSLNQFRTRDEARFPLEVFDDYGEYLESVGRKLDDDERRSIAGSLTSLREELQTRDLSSLPKGLKLSAIRSVERGLTIVSPP